MSKTYLILSYDFGKTDKEIFSMPMDRINVLLGEWVKEIGKRKTY